MRPSKAHGFTLVEVAVATALVGALTLLIVQSLADLARTQAFSEGQAKIAEAADRVMRTLARDVTFSVCTFTDGEQADDYLAVMDYPEAEAAVDSRLPRKIQSGYFEADPIDSPETGNLLFLARFQQPAVVDVAASPPPKEYRLDLLNFVLYYPKPTPAGDLDLARWASVVVVRHQDAMTIATEAERATALGKLYAQGIRYTWDVNAPAATGLFAIAENGVLTPLPASVKLPGDATQARSSVVGSRQIHLAGNGTKLKVPVPLYAVPLPQGFPGGFELKVDGPGAGKLVLLRLVLRSGAGDSRDNFAEIVRLVSCR